MFYYGTDESGGESAVKARVQALVTDALVIANKVRSIQFLTEAN